MPFYLNKLRGVTVQQDGEQVPGTGRVSGLNFRNQLVDYDPISGIATIGPATSETRAEVHAATTAALATYTFASNSLTKSSNGALGAIDGVTLTTNQRLLVKNESGANEKYNGWYYVADPGSASTPWILTRSADADASSEFFAGSVSKVLSGTVNGGKWFSLTSGYPSTFTLNTDIVVFVDYFPQSSILKDTVRVATAAALAANSRSGNILTATANGALAAIDGITMAVDDRVLVKNEAAGANNGIYRITSLGSGGSPWTMARAADAQSSAQVTPNIMVPVSEGTVNHDQLFHLTTNATITLNSTALTFETLAVAAPGSTLQLLYNNAGVIAGAASVTVVGSGTALAFGSTVSSKGLLRTPAGGFGSDGGLIISGLNGAGTQSMNILRADNTDKVFIGDPTVAAQVVASVQTGGQFAIRVNNTEVYTLTSAVADFKSVVAQFGTTPATAGTLRLPQVSTIQFRNNANSANLNVIRLGSTTDDVWIGDTVSGCDTTIFAATTITFGPGGAAEYTMTATALDLADNNLTNVGDFDHDGTNLGFYGTTPIAKQTVSGATGGNAALQDLLLKLENLGIINDSTT